MVSFNEIHHPQLHHWDMLYMYVQVMHNCSVRCIVVTVNDSHFSLSLSRVPHSGLGGCDSWGHWTIHCSEFHTTCVDAAVACISCLTVTSSCLCVFTGNHFLDIFILPPSPLFFSLPPSSPLLPSLLSSLLSSLPPLLPPLLSSPPLPSPPLPSPPGGKGVSPGDEM